MKREVRGIKIFQMVNGVVSGRYWDSELGWKGGGEGERELKLRGLRRGVEWIELAEEVVVRTQQEKSRGRRNGGRG